MIKTKHKTQPKQLKKPKEETKQLKKPKEETKQLKKPKEETKQLKKPKEETKQLKKPKEETKQLKKPKEETKQLKKPKEETKQLKKPKEETKQLKKPKEETKQLKKPKEETKQSKQAKKPKKIYKGGNNSTLAFTYQIKDINSAIDKYVIIFIERQRKLLHLCNNFINKLKESEESLNNKYKFSSYSTKYDKSKHVTLINKEFYENIFKNYFIPILQIINKDNIITEQNDLKKIAEYLNFITDDDIETNDEKRKKINKDFEIFKTYVTDDNIDEVELKRDVENTLDKLKNLMATTKFDKDKIIDIKDLKEKLDIINNKIDKWKVPLWKDILLSTFYSDIETINKKELHKYNKIYIDAICNFLSIESSELNNYDGEESTSKIKNEIQKALTKINEIKGDENNEKDTSELLNIVLINIKKLLLNLINKNYTKNISSIQKLKQYCKKETAEIDKYIDKYKIKLDEYCMQKTSSIPEEAAEEAAKKEEDAAKTTAAEDAARKAAEEEAARKEAEDAARKAEEAKEEEEEEEQTPEDAAEDARQKAEEQRIAEEEERLRKAAEQAQAQAAAEDARQKAEEQRIAEEERLRKAAEQAQAQAAEQAAAEDAAKKKEEEERLRKAAEQAQAQAQAAAEDAAKKKEEEERLRKAAEQAQAQAQAQAAEEEAARKAAAKTKAAEEAVAAEEARKAAAVAAEEEAARKAVEQAKKEAASEGVGIKLHGLQQPHWKQLPALPSQPQLLPSVQQSTNEDIVRMIKIIQYCNRQYNGNFESNSVIYIYPPNYIGPFYLGSNVFNREPVKMNDQNLIKNLTISWNNLINYYINISEFNADKYITTFRKVIRIYNNHLQETKNIADVNNAIKNITDGIDGYVKKYGNKYYYDRTYNIDKYQNEKSLLDLVGDAQIFFQNKTPKKYTHVNKYGYPLILAYHKCNLLIDDIRSRMDGGNNKKNIRNVSISKESKYKVCGYVTDVEGNMDYFNKYVKISKILEWTNDKKNRLRFKKGDSIFVYGGDTQDKGQADIRFANILLKFKEDYPERVIFIIGNRDANKLRIPSELFETYKNEKIFLKKYDNYPYWIDSDKRITLRTYLKENNYELNIKNRLKYIIESNMGFEDGFEKRRTELSIILKKNISKITDTDVISSFVNSVMPFPENIELSNDNYILKYLMKGQIAYIFGEHIFVHGAINEYNIGQIPKNKNKIDDINIWVNELNSWFHKELNEYINNPTIGGITKKRKAYNIIDYVIPKEKSISVVHANNLKKGNGKHINKNVSKILNKYGIKNIITGHKPHGDCPLVIRDKNITAISADTSYSNVNYLREKNKIDGDSRGNAVSEVLLYSNGYIRIHGKYANNSKYSYILKERANEKNMELNDYIGMQLNNKYWIKNIKKDKFLISYGKDYELYEKWISLKEVKELLK